MSWWQVSLHYHGRRLITRDGPAQGLLEWPQHRWESLPLVNGRAKALALAAEQETHAVVTVPYSGMPEDKIFDNGKPPLVPPGWHPADAVTCADPRRRVA